MTFHRYKSPMALLLCATLPLAILAGCGDSADGWFIISKPGGSGLTAGVVKKGNNSTLSLVRAPGGSETFLLHDKLGDVTREQYYAVESDLVLSQETHGIVLESPAFAQGRRRLPKSATVELGRDSATLMKLRVPGTDESPSEVWWISGWGNLLLQQTDEGLRVYQEGQPAWHLDAGAEVEARDHSYEVRDRMGKLLLLQPGPPPKPEQRMAYVAERKAVQFFDARGRVVAELPAEGIEIAPEGQALFLTGRYPQGLHGISDRPVSVLVPRHNRHLILLTH